MSSLSPAEKAISGAVASVLANTIVYPLDLVKTIIQTQDSSNKKYSSSIDCLVKLYKTKGLSHLYSGLKSSLVGTALQNFYYFYWYSILRNIYNKLPNKSVKNKKILDELVIGILAASITQFFISPINVVTTKQQTVDSVSSEEESKHPESMIEAGYKIAKEDGITELWKGLKVSLVLSLNPSITYGSYERLKNLFFKDKEFLNPLESFNLGLLSKIIATLITQPLIVSKLNLQSGSNKFQTFQSVLVSLYKEEGIKGLWKGLGPQILKASLVQGFLFMFKEQFDLFILVLIKFITHKKR